jgi:hypothetical protein
MSKAIVIDQTGGPENMKLVDVTVGAHAVATGHGRRRRD